MATPARKSASLISQIQFFSLVPHPETEHKLQLPSSLPTSPVNSTHHPFLTSLPPVITYLSPQLQQALPTKPQAVSDRKQGGLPTDLLLSLSIPQDPIPQSPTPVYIPASNTNRLWKHEANRSVKQATYIHHTPWKSREKIKHPPTKTKPEITI